MKLLLLTLATLLGLALTSPIDDNKIFDCLTNPCLTVPGVGKLKGTKKESAVTSRDIYSYYSIPYGKPTSGELRFAPPVIADPVNDGNDVFDATYLTYLWNAMGRVCPQAGISLKGSYMKMMSEVPLEDADGFTLNQTLRAGEDVSMAGSEDCLHLAVFTPRKPSEIGEKPLLPVMFYIHGGAFYMGAYLGSGPKELLEKDVVLVEIQYRLGPLGFMCLDHDDAAGNMGLLDQALALEWVREHIAGFGGNPEDITIFGQSAGSASVSYHLLSPKSRDNFHKVIGQSGSALAGWAFDNEPERHAKEIAKLLDCPTDSLDAMINCMKYERSAQQIVAKHHQYMKSEQYNGRMGFGGSIPCAQTKGKDIFIDKHPEDYLRTGDFQPKPALFGANKHEGSFVLGVMYNNFIVLHGHQLNDDFLTHEFIPVMLDALGLNDASGVIYEIIEHDYFALRDVGDWDRMMPGMINLVGTFFIKAAAHEFMRYNFRRGAPSYFYSLDYEGSNSLFNLLFTSGNVPPVPHGCTHGDDLLYLFSTGFFSFNDEDTKIRRQMVDLWTNFVIHGELTPANSLVEGIPTVPQWTEDEPVYLQIDRLSTLRTDYVASWSNPNIDNKV